MLKKGDIVCIPDYKKDDDIWITIGYVSTMPKYIKENSPCEISHINIIGREVSLKECKNGFYYPIEIFQLYDAEEVEKVKKEKRIGRIKRVKL